MRGKGFDLRKRVKDYFSVTHDERKYGAGIYQLIDLKRRVVTPQDAHKISMTKLIAAIVDQQPGNEFMQTTRSVKP